MKVDLGLRSSLHWLILVLFYAHFVQWSIFPLTNIFKRSDCIFAQRCFFVQREGVKYSPAQRTFGRHGRLKFLIVFPKLCWIGRAWQYNWCIKDESLDNKVHIHLNAGQTHNTYCMFVFGQILGCSYTGLKV